MATIRQKKLAEAIVENLSQAKPKNKKELLVSSGYSKNTSESSANDIIEQKGVQEELKILGFSSEKAKEVVAEILEFGENDGVKLKAADMIFKVNSDYAAEKHMNVNVDFKIDDSALDEAAKAYGEAVIKRKIS